MGDHDLEIDVDQTQSAIYPLMSKFLRIQEIHFCQSNDHFEYNNKIYLEIWNK